MQSPDISIALARAQLGSFVAQMSRLAAEAPWLFEGTYEQRVASTLDHLRKAQDRLANPVLRLATFGTTSSGKSTIVNALVGRPVAPMDTKELSAGILQVVDRDERSLEIAATEGASWETGNFRGDDASLYERLKGVLSSYRASGGRKCAWPEAIISGPLLPARWPELLGLPLGVGFEVFDLPGVQHAHDQQSLQVLRKEVLGAFCLVALDYAHTDKTSRASLLTELKRAVDALDGRTDAMVFVLNRVDIRGPSDEPLADRIFDIENEIGTALALPENPTIHPLCAKVLYYAQAIWGPGPLDAEPACPPDVARALFRDFRDDPVYGSLARRAEDDEDFAGHLRKLRADPGDVQERRWLLRGTLESSGGRRLWEAIGDRVAEQFAPLVLFPALAEALSESTVVLAAADETCRIKQIATTAEVLQQRRDLADALVALKATLSANRTEFQDRLSRALAGFRTREAAKVNAAADLLGEHFKPVRDVVKKVDDDVNAALIVPVRDAFINGSSVKELEDVLEAAVGRDSASSLCKAIDLYRAAGMTKDAARNGLTVERNKGSLNEVEEISKAAQRVYDRVRNCLGQRAGLKFQEQARVFEGALAQVLEEHGASLSAQVATLFEHDGAVAAALRAAALPAGDFPAVSFRIGDAKTPTGGTSTQFVGWDRRSCSSDRPIYDTVDVVRLRLPKADEMATEWSNGVQAEHGRLWDIVGTWMAERVVQQSERFEQALLQVQSHLDHQYEARLVELDTSHDIEQSLLAGTSSEIADARKAVNALGALARGGE